MMIVKINHFVHFFTVPVKERQKVKNLWDVTWIIIQLHFVEYR